MQQMNKNTRKWNIKHVDWIVYAVLCVFFLIQIATFSYKGKNFGVVLTFRNDNNYFKYKKDLKTFFKNNPQYQIVWGQMEGLASIYLKEAKKAGVKWTIAHSHITSAERSLKGLIKRILPQERKNNSRIVIESGYDLKTLVKWIEKQLRSLSIGEEILLED